MSTTRGKRDRARVLESSESESAPSSPDAPQNENPAEATPLVESRAGLVENAEEDAETQMPSVSQDPQRTQQDGEMLGDLTDLSNERLMPLEPISDYYTSDFDKIPELLRNRLSMQTFDLPIDICQDVHGILKCDPVHFGTMNSVSKSFVMIPHDDLSHYVQPYEGAPFTFVDR